MMPTLRIACTHPHTAHAFIHARKSLRCCITPMPPQSLPLTIITTATTTITTTITPTTLRCTPDSLSSALISMRLTSPATATLRFDVTSLAKFLLLCCLSPNTPLASHRLIFGQCSEICTLFLPASSPIPSSATLCDLPPSPPHPPNQLAWPIMIDRRASQVGHACLFLCVTAEFRPCAAQSTPCAG